jgi:hypothetical protein
MLKTTFLNRTFEICQNVYSNTLAYDDIRGIMTEEQVIVQVR